MIKLYDNCRIVKGSKYTIIQDNRRNSIHRIPEEVGDYFDPIKKTNLSTSFKKEIETFLISNEFGFETTTPELFPESGDGFRDFSDIEYFIFEYSKKNQYYLDKIFNDLSILRVLHIEIRICDFFTVDKIEKIVKLVEESGARSLDLYVSFNHEKDISFYNNLILRFPIINIVVLHSAPSNTDFKPENKLLISNSVIDSSKCCGKINLDTMIVSFESYRISQKGNSCLFKKVAVDKDGFLKNCPSMMSNYGNIKSDDLLDLLDNNEFKKYFYITKDIVKTCQDCEYRNACSDCRAYVEDPDDILSKPLKCGYNPYTGEWSEWSTNPLKQKAIDFYGMRGMLEEGKNKSE